LLVLNDTLVIPARLHAQKPSGGRVEVLLVERIASEDRPAPEWREQWRVLLKGMGRASEAASLRFDAPFVAEVCERGPRGAARLRFSGRGKGGLLGAIDGVGEMPLPPYIEAARRRHREIPSVDDRERYQTVFAREPGAVAAPTAGLHFTPALLDEIRAAGHEVAHLTLHVGPGTFRPVTTADPARHRLDAERFTVGPAAAAAIRGAQADGRPIVAVGTTVVRTLETLGRAGAILPGTGSTELLLLPGAEFRVVSDLITNFHLPKSSLLMLVAAFAGRERVLSAYREAIARGYRFYSYGDAMFIRPGASPS
jgi:S-adenosylmethionine:tRNA ribosyltransferase-isomerase